MAHNDLSRRQLYHRCDGECRCSTPRRVDCEDEVPGIVTAQLRPDVHGDLGATAFEEGVHVLGGEGLSGAVGRHTHALA